MDNLNGHVMTLANSIIGVSILAMPYCFKQCGITLSIAMLLISSAISRLSCHFLLKSAIITRRKTFEFLAFHIFGKSGKFIIEIGIIGFLLGTCIAFFVVMGELGPQIAAEMSNMSSTNTMRTSILMALALFVVLPLGMLRNVDSFSGVSKATIGFYCCLVLKVVFEAIPHIVTGDWYQRVYFWRPQGLLQCLPIFSMALFCQTQLFEMYQAINNATLDRMNNLVKVAMTICTSVYIFVGTFGYIAFADKNITGNILLSFSPSFMTNLLKLGFVLSIAFSFPLIIFPCRASLYSLLFKEGYALHEGTSNYIPEGRFKALTMFIVSISLVVGLLIPNIELVLGLVGSTISIMICLLFPMACFIYVSQKNTNEYLIAQLMLFVGIFIMVLGTYENLYTVDPIKVSISTLNTNDQLPVLKNNGLNIPIISTEKPIILKKIEGNTGSIIKVTDKIMEVRHEPPQPVEPSDEEVTEKKHLSKVISSQKIEIKSNILNDTKVEQVDIEAIKKEDKEEALEAKDKIKDDTNQVLLDTIKKQSAVQIELVEQQKKILEVMQSQQEKEQKAKVEKLNEEKLKAVKQIEAIAKKAIEKISAGKANIVDAEKEVVNAIHEMNEGDDVPVEKDKSKKNKTHVRMRKKFLRPDKNASVHRDIQDNTLLKTKSKNNIAVNLNEVPKYEEKTEKNYSKETNAKAEIIKKQLIENLEKGEMTVKQSVPELKSINLGMVNGDQPKPKNIPEVMNAYNSGGRVAAANKQLNKTAPLLINLGKQEIKSNVLDLVPIVVATSGKNNTGPRNADVINNVKPITEVSKQHDSMVKATSQKVTPAIGNEVHIINRDILGFVSRR